MKIKQLILWDPPSRQLHPLTLTRPAAALRMGITTLQEKWEAHFDLPASHATRAYLAPKFPIEWSVLNIVVNGTVVANPTLTQFIQNHLPTGTLLTKSGTPIAFKGSRVQVEQWWQQTPPPEQWLEYPGECLMIERPWDLFVHNGAVLSQDFERLTTGRSSQPLSTTNTLIGDPNDLFIEEGAWIEGATLNTQPGPIYVGKGATIMEGSLVRGGLALCAGSTLKMGSKIYGPTTIGPICKVGGEVTNSIFIGYSNKGHEGYLGNAILGEWCNLGADTNSSNLKNNYANVKVWDYEEKCFMDSEQQFCGLIMGDHSKSGINTMFNTGTVVGVACNIYGGDFPRNFVPSFSWGNARKMTTYQLPKALETAALVMARRQLPLTKIDQAILEYVFHEDAEYRRS